MRRWRAATLWGLAWWWCSALAGGSSQQQQSHSAAAGSSSASPPPLDVVFAVNAGGEAHVGHGGVEYAKDPLHVGTASDYGRRLATISRAPPEDRALYQTERYHRGTFGYDIPADEDGDYVLVLKFSEVYFDAPDMKVFDVVLNGDHTVVADLDIYDRVGRGVAHDEYVAYRIRDGRLHYDEDESSDIRNGKIRVEFIKGYRDNPKVNALYVVRGTLDRVPRLPPLQQPSASERAAASSYDEDSKEESNGKEGEGGEKASKPRRPSGPRQPDPYQTDDSSYLLPVFVAIGAFVPFLFCLCKL